MYAKTLSFSFSQRRTKKEQEIFHLSFIIVLGEKDVLRQT